ncbi:hypothetical protein Paes_1771 [Prosthecochloris aestuarii DSM 271]|uniref:Uncharacterized protein n=1 Tax=Prosthecochloris aestuarii (strain DSM 271 / SK 413) TaxID=290512 RepID=B4S3Z2_PROA2|nr:hypothetical protein Paes_1771 [Prosthecochloris aestuarii DSM 271]
MRAFHINVTFGAVNSCAGGACGAGTKNAFGFGDESREARDRSAFGTGDRGRLRRQRPETGDWSACGAVTCDEGACGAVFGPQIPQIVTEKSFFLVLCPSVQSVCNKALQRFSLPVTRDRSPASPLHHSPSFVICAGSLLAALPPAPRPYTEPFGQ